jgi:hypothetical protein
VSRTTIYWVTSYYLRPGKATEYQKWLTSDEAKRLFDQFERETGFKYVNTYMPILGFGDYDAEEWFAAPDWAAFDKSRESKAFDELVLKTWDMVDQTRTAKARAMRSVKEVMITEKTEK